MFRYLRVDILVVLDDSGLVAVRCLRTGEWNRQDHVALFEEMPSSVIAHQILRRRRSGLLPFADYAPGTAETMDHMKSQIDSFREHIYAQLAFPLQPPERQRAAAKLAEQGFAGLFPGQVHDLAMYSLVFGGEGLQLPQGAALLNRTEAAVRKRLETFNAAALDQLGVTVFAPDGASGTVTSAL